MVGRNKRDLREEREICRGIKASHACWLAPCPTIHSSGAACQTLQSLANKKHKAFDRMSATITFKEVPSQSIICQLSFLTSLYMLAFPLIYLISDGGSCGLTAGKSVPPPCCPCPSLLLPPTRSTSRCPTRSAY